MISYFQRTLKDRHIKSIEQHKAGVWVHAVNPTEEELQILSSELSLEPGHLRDALDPHEVPRLELENNIPYIFTRVPITDHETIITVPLLLIITETSLITVCSVPLQLFDKFLDGKITVFTTQKVKLFIQIFTEIIGSFNNSLTAINKKTRNVSINLEKIRNREILQLVTYEQILDDFHNALERTNAILNKLLTGKTLQLFEQDRELIEDLFLASGQLVELTQSSLSSVKNIRDAYSTIMTNNLNRIIKLFTSLTIILTIPTIIASLYGMNVPLPFSDHPQAFFGVLGVITIISAGLVVLFFHQDWL